MAYGVQIYTAGMELVNNFVPTFIVDYITAPASGSRTYGGVTGKTLVAHPLAYIAPTSSSASKSPVTASVSGNTVTWNNAGDQTPLIMAYE